MMSIRSVIPLQAAEAGNPEDELTSGGPEIVLLDAEGVIVAVNRAWRASGRMRRLGAARTGAGAHYFDVASHCQPHLSRETFQTALGALRRGERSEIHYAYALETARGPRWRQVQITSLQLSSEIRFVAIHEDLTDLVRAVDALRRTSDQLLHAQEDERQRIAIELHDSTSQHLAAMALGLSRLHVLAPHPKARAILDDVRRSLDDALRETRVLSYLMSPPDLAERRLIAAARRFAEGFGRRTGLAIEFYATGPVDDTSATVQHAAFRIVQESLSNVYRHAEAARAVVRLEASDGNLQVRVSDDGRGIQPALDGSGDVLLGVGIPGMRARAAQLGGQLSITSEGVGTHIHATLPVT